MSVRADPDGTGGAGIRKPARVVIITTAVTLVGLCTLIARPLAQPNFELPLAISHIHLTVGDFDVHRKFWVTMLGGRPGGFRPELQPDRPPFVAFPKFLVGFTAGTAQGGTIGSTLDHVAFEVSDLQGLLATVRTAGYPIVTKSAASTGAQLTGDTAFLPGEGLTVAYVLAPGDVLVEFVAGGRQPGPSFHHVHLMAPASEVAAMKAWYVRALGAQVGTRGTGFETLDLPGAKGALVFSPARDVGAKPASTKGRAADHFGFEVRNLREFAAKLESAGLPLTRPYTKVANSDFSVAFLADPWGTAVELSEHPSRRFFELKR
jgi:catechol 2,3-dioxygenase-like lactoylglutathione lyase family enzyme